MSESPALNYQSPSMGQPASLVRVGGALGIAASSICMLIFIVACFGFDAAFKGLPIVPLCLSVPGMILTIIGATLRKSRADEDTQILAAMFVNLIGFAAALIELSLWLNWNLFYQQQGGM